MSKMQRALWSRTMFLFYHEWTLCIKQVSGLSCSKESHPHVDSCSTTLILQLKTRQAMPACILFQELINYFLRLQRHCIFHAIIREIMKNPNLNINGIVSCDSTPNTVQRSHQKHVLISIEYFFRQINVFTIKKLLIKS